MDLTVVKELLEAFGGDVQFHAHEKEDDVVNLMSVRFEQLPDTKVLRVDDDWYTPYYQFTVGKTKIGVFGQRQTTAAEAEARIAFWQPYVREAK